MDYPLGCFVGASRRATYLYRREHACPTERSFKLSRKRSIVLCFDLYSRPFRSRQNPDGSLSTLSSRSSEQNPNGRLSTLLLLDPQNKSRRQTFDAASSRSSEQIQTTGFGLSFSAFRTAPSPQNVAKSARHATPPIRRDDTRYTAEEHGCFSGSPHFEELHTFPLEIGVT